MLFREASNRHCFGDNFGDHFQRRDSPEDPLEGRSLKDVSRENPVDDSKRSLLKMT